MDWTQITGIVGAIAGVSAIFLDFMRHRLDKRRDERQYGLEDKRLLLDQQRQEIDNYGQVTTIQSSVTSNQRAEIDNIARRLRETETDFDEYRNKENLMKDELVVLLQEIIDRFDACPGQCTIIELQSDSSLKEKIKRFRRMYSV